MSEYQYYEWLALDRPLDKKQLAEVEQLSSHMEQVSPTQAVVTYSWGNFKHNPLNVLARYFDAFLYAANWGTRQLAFRFPKQSIATSALKPYLIDGVISVKRDGAFVILDIMFADQEGREYDWIDVEGMLGRIAGVRRQLINGDYRALYLVWLATISRGEGSDDYDDEDDDNDEDEDLEEDDDGDDGDGDDRFVSAEPPVPAGLRTLDGSLAALCEFFDIDRHLVEAASATSAKTATPSTEELRAAIHKLPRERVDAYLLRLLDEEPQLGSTLRTELSLKGSSAPERQGKGRTARTLRAEATALSKQAQQRELKRAQKARMAELDKLARREDSAWHEVDTLLRQQRAASYNAAVQQLTDLRDLARRRDTATAFAAHLTKIVQEFGKSRALMNRLSKAQLL